MSLYKMKFEYSRQPWYDPDGVYILIEKHQDRYLAIFGTDCTWENVVTGKQINNWYHVMTPLTQLEVREFNLNRII
jgi:hypothetical protein